MYICIYAFSGDFSRMCKTTPLLEYWAAGWCPSTAKTHQRGSFWRVRQTALNESSKSMFLGPWVSWATFGHLFNAVSTRFQRGFPGTPNSDYPGRWDLRGGGWYQSFLYTTAIIIIPLQLLPAEIILEPEPQHSPHRTANATPWTVNQQTASAPTRHAAV